MTGRPIQNKVGPEIRVDIWSNAGKGEEVCTRQPPHEQILTPAVPVRLDEILYKERRWPLWMEES